MAQINEHLRLRDKCRCFTNILSNSCHLSIRVIRDLKAQYVNYLVKVQKTVSVGIAIATELFPGPNFPDDQVVKIHRGGGVVFKDVDDQANGPGG